MERKFRITVEGRAFVVTVEDLTETAGSSLYPAPGSMQVPLGSVVAPAVVGNGGAALPVSAPVPAGGAVVSNLGGIVESIHVAVGDNVAPGDRVATVEAMKMKNAIVADHPGRVTAVHVKPGDAVDAGQLLVSLG